MARLVATERGYFGGRIVEIGESFAVPDDLWRDVRRRPSWARLDPAHAFGGKGDHDGDVPAALVVPADWRSSHHATRKALARAITGNAPADLAEADRVIANYVESTKPTSDPAGNGVVAALGGPAPDWVPPSVIVSA